MPQKSKPANCSGILVLLVLGEKQLRLSVQRWPTNLVQLSMSSRMTNSVVVQTFLRPFQDNDVFK